jgi:ATP-binding cassette, subfamily B, multidrug efflux pump
MKTIILQLKPFRRQLILIGLLDLFATLAALAMPYLMSDIINTGIREKQLQYIMDKGVAMLLLSIFALICGVFVTKYNARVASGFTYNLRKAIFQKINTLTFQEYGQYGAGSLLTRSTEDILILQEASGGLVYALVTVPILFIGGSVLAFKSDWLLALVLIVLVPLVLFIVWIATRNMGNLWLNSDKFIDVQNKVVNERLSGIRVIRAFDKEDHEQNRVACATREMAKNIIKANILAGLINPLSMFFLNISIVVMLYISALRIQTEPLLDAGSVIATIQYVALIMNGLLILSWTFAWLPHLKVCAVRVAEILNLQGAPVNPPSGETLSGHLQIRDLTFFHEGSEHPTLSNLTLEIKEGEVVAIIGGTGSGKSSLAKLIMGFYQTSSGSITLGGRQYGDIKMETVRDNISITLQRNTIFHGSIEDNIRFGNPDATYEKMEEVTKVAEINKFVHSHKEGYKYVLSQAGANISGGQKQRICIARALIKSASVYLFDDSFSSVDYLTESKLRKKLNKYLAGKTQIIVTQRAATAMRCDKIYVLDRGALVGSGNHKELLASCAIYREIYDSQLGGTL